MNVTIRRNFFFAMSFVLLIANANATVEAAQYAITDIGVFGGFRSYGTGINSSGQVSGYSMYAMFGGTHAFVFDDVTAIHDIEALGGSRSTGYAIHIAGHVNGLDITGFTANVFLYDGKSMRDLGNLNGKQTIGTAINDLDQVAGYVSSYQGNNY